MATIAVSSLAAQAAPVPVISYLFDDNTTPQHGSVTGTLYGPNGTQTSGPTYSSVTPFSYTGNKSLKLDGTDDHMRFGFQTVGQAINGASAVTLTMWIRFEDNGDLRGGEFDNSFFTSRVGSANSGASNIVGYVRHDTGNNAKVEFGGRDQSGAAYQAGTNSTVLTAGAWHFVVGILDYANDKVQISIDGGTLQSFNVSFASSTYLNSTPASSVYDAVGGGANVETYPFKGSVDELGIFTSALSQDDITYFYQNGLNAVPEPSSIGLGALGLFGVLGSRRRHHAR